MSRNVINKLSSGDKIDNKRLCELFGCSPQGGMRKSNSTSTLVVVSNHIKSIYDDRWEGDTLHYTGMGTKGDQSLEFAQNKTLANSNTNGVDVYLFEVFRNKEYTYAGQVTLAAKPYSEKQPDENGVVRLVYVFPLKLLSGTHHVIAEDQKNVYDVKRKKAKKLNDEELANRAKQSRLKPSASQQTSTVYERNVWVAEYAKRLAGGICQLCLQPAPFQTQKNEPYLETHHIKWLSRGGTDTPSNTIALCPNCHKKMHIIDLKEDIALLSKKAKSLLDS
ncbi:HNH endonuclease [Vibrio parahaemolyticus]|nr:HNH endonuclease [Vibrio parahaemolyticus]